MLQGAEDGFAEDEDAGDREERAEDGEGDLGVAGVGEVVVALDVDSLEVREVEVGDGLDGAAGFKVGGEDFGLIDAVAAGVGGGGEFFKGLVEGGGAGEGGIREFFFAGQGDVAGLVVGALFEFGIGGGDLRLCERGVGPRVGEGHFVEGIDAAGHLAAAVDA